MDPVRDRALGALTGLALGDALGMPTQTLSRDRAEELLGAGPHLLPGPADNPISAGLPAGTVTDDTEQALVLARLLVAGRGRLDVRALADALLDWEDGVRGRGSLDLLGPTTRGALAAIRAGADPATTGRGGTTNGASMRIAPVGVATPPDPARLAAAVEAACRPTHDSPEALTAALAVAAVVSLGVDGVGVEAAVPLALEIVRGRRYAASGGADVAELVDAAVRLARRAEADGGVPAALAAIADRVGTGLESRESVPAAFAISALRPLDAWQAAGLAARLGGDTDTIAAIAGAMVGACTGAAGLPAAAVATVTAASGLDLGPIVDGLLALREDLR